MSAGNHVKRLFQLTARAIVRGAGPLGTACVANASRALLSLRGASGESADPDAVHTPPGSSPLAAGFLADHAPALLRAIDMVSAVTTFPTTASLLLWDLLNVTSTPFSVALIQDRHALAALGFHLPNAPMSQSIDFAMWVSCSAAMRVLELLTGAIEAPGVPMSNAHRRTLAEYVAVVHAIVTRHPMVLYRDFKAVRAWGGAMVEVLRLVRVVPGISASLTGQRAAKSMVAIMDPHFLPEVRCSAGVAPRLVEMVLDMGWASVEMCLLAANTRADCPRSLRVADPASYVALATRTAWRISLVGPGHTLYIQDAPAGAMIVVAPPGVSPTTPQSDPLQAFEQLVLRKKRRAVDAVDTRCPKRARVR